MGPSRSLRPMQRRGPGQPSALLPQNRAVGAINAVDVGVVAKEKSSRVSSVVVKRLRGLSLRTRGAPHSREW